MKRDYSAKPAYRTYGFLANTLANYTAARRDDPEAGVIGYRFTVPAGELTILWTSKKGDKKTYHFTAHGQTSVLSLTGVEEASVNPLAMDVVTVENSPKFLFEMKPE